MLPAILWILGCAIAGAAVGAAWDFMTMSDEDTQAVSDWLVDHDHPRLLSAYCFLVKARSKVRRMLGIRVHDDPEEIHVVRESTMSEDELPAEVREQLRRDGQVTFDLEADALEAAY